LLLSFLPAQLEAFRVQLKAANEGTDVTEEELYQFLKHFHLLNYYLAKEKGISFGKDSRVIKVTPSSLNNLCKQ
jgi:hypothetical protein